MTADDIVSGAGAPPEDRAAALLATMTLAEKVALALGDYDAVAHLGIPALAYADGGAGVRDGDGATAFPCTLALAATFDPALAAAYGAAIGDELRAAGGNVLLGPAVDIVRTPLGGRAAESFGEDPHLASAMAAAHVRGVQSRNVVAMVKHCVANNFELRRTGFGPVARRGPAVDVLVGDRALHEIYLEPVRGALVDGGALSVMGSYNRINGAYACESPWLLTGVLKEDWAWPGFVAPDFALAVRDDVAAANAGLDIAALDGAGNRTAEDFTSGRIPADRLDDIVRRVLHGMFAGGLGQDPDGADAPGPSTAADHDAVATRAARDGMVLLANRERLLPLAPDATRSIAVIGPAGEDALYTLEGSGAVAVARDRLVTPLAGLTARAGAGVKVSFVQGSYGDVRLDVVPGDVLGTPDGDAPGLRAEYWQDDAEGAPALAAVEPTLDLRTPPEGLTTPWRARWSGTLTPTRDGRHRFSLTGTGSVALYLDDVLVVEGAREAVRLAGGPEVPLQGVADLRAGRAVALRVEYETGPALDIAGIPTKDVWGEDAPPGIGVQMQLGWQPPDDLVDDAARLAAGSDVAVVLVGASSGEGGDRSSLALPGDQDALVAAVAAANPRTVVVLNTPGAVLMPWLDDVGAVLQAWYPGQPFGDALAAVLFGDADPGGRLPVTFPATEEQGPITGPERYPGIDGVARYDEGVEVGYRWFDAHGEEPLFPFGHGLSYGEYRYDGLRVDHDPAAGTTTVGVDVENVAARAGSEVVQVYLALPAEADAPPRKLVAFRKVHLGAGERASVRIDLAARDLAVFGEADGRWVVHPGRYTVSVGASSRDLRATATFEAGRR